MTLIYRLILLLLVSTHTICSVSYAQTRYNRSLQTFDAQAKQTKEYRALQQETDSINSNPNNVPQALNFVISLKEADEDGGNFLFGTVERTVASKTVKLYDMKYDKTQKKIVSISKLGDDSK